MWKWTQEREYVNMLNREGLKTPRIKFKKSIISIVKKNLSELSESWKSAFESSIEAHTIQNKLATGDSKEK